jgi:hypothetical protein
MVGQTPQKVRGYMVKWLGKTHYCGKLSEVREWPISAICKTLGLVC